MCLNFLIFYVHWKFACVLCMGTDNFSKCNLPFQNDYPAASCRLSLYSYLYVCFYFCMYGYLFMYIRQRVWR